MSQLKKMKRNGARFHEYKQRVKVMEYLNAPKTVTKKQSLINKIICNLKEKFTALVKRNK